MCIYMRKQTRTQQSKFGLQDVSSLLQTYHLWMTGRKQGGYSLLSHGVNIVVHSCGPHGMWSRSRLGDFRLLDDPCIGSNMLSFVQVRARRYLCICTYTNNGVVEGTVGPFRNIVDVQSTFEYAGGFSKGGGWDVFVCAPAVSGG